MSESIPRSEWVQALQRFTERNASRITELEIDDPELGAQAEEHDYPLRGVAYDRHDDRIEIMLGDLERASPHVTHSIEHPTALEILTDDEGHDEVLRIGRGAGQTLLRLRRSTG